MIRMVALPALTAIFSVALAVAIYLWLPEGIQPADGATATLMVVALVAIILALASFVLMLRLGARLTRSSEGFDSFEADMRRRLVKVERALAQPETGYRDTASAGESATAAMSEPNTQPGIAKAGGDIAETASKMAEEQPEAGDEKVIQFDAAARGKTSHLPQARLIGAKLTRALEKNSIEAWFQPVVGLPGRKTRFFEAIAYVTDEADATETARCIAPAYSNAPEIDRRMLLQSLKLLRALDRNGKHAGVIWRLHESSLGDAHAFSGLERILDANSALADQLVARIEYRDYTGLDQAQVDRLHRLREMGFALAIANCPNGAEVHQALQSSLFSIFIVDASRLVAEVGEERPIHQIIANEQDHPEVEIIASGVTDEHQAMALIDHDILLAQGDFFCEPRPMRRDGGLSSATGM